jgi:hypothetical protein
MRVSNHPLHKTLLSSFSHSHRRELPVKKKLMGLKKSGGREKDIINE